MDRTAETMTPVHPAQWWHSLGGQRVQCDLCPHGCQLTNGRKGHCQVRENRDGTLGSTAYGVTSGFSLDPVEKKPLYHFLPGTQTLSFGTIGCNLTCRFCQNWGISQPQDRFRPVEKASPVQIALLARSRCPSVSFTYNEPATFAEFALDTATEVHALGLKTIAVTAGYFQPAPAREFFSQMDAANVDLKGFSEEFYQEFCGGSLAPVLETLRIIRHETPCFLEVTNLLIPGANDSHREIRDLSRWICRELGEMVPLHFSTFHPDHHLRDRGPTPAATVVLAREIALEEGLQFVYTGHVRDQDGSHTRCPRCGTTLVTRESFRVLNNRIGANGTCPCCGATVPGLWC